MAHADAFLQDILAHPDDDAPRLIFADWLEEQGDAGSVARAEFIRVQCSLAAGRLTPQRRVELDRRQQQILEAFDEEWSRPIRQRVRTWNFHRGFIDEVAMWSAEFLGSADDLFCQLPIQHLRLWPGVASAGSQRFSVAVLAESEYLRHLRSLDLSGNRLDSRDVRALVVSNHLTGLISLRLAFNQIGDLGIRVLAESPLLGWLAHLDLRNNQFGPAGVRALSRALLRLARSSNELSLQTVELQYNNLGYAGQRLLASSPLLRRVVRW